MRLCIRTGAAILLLSCAALTFAQNTIRTGFVVVTLVSGNFAGLIANETLINTTERGVMQTGVSPATLLTNAAMPVNIGPETLGTTAIAFANPSISVGEVNVLLTSADGVRILDTIVPLGPQAQFSRFLNELFVDQSRLAARQVGLLTLTSSIPVALVGIDFRSGAFSTVPVSSLGFPLPVPIQQTVTTVGGQTFAFGTPSTPLPPVVATTPAGTVVTPSAPLVPTTAFATVVAPTAPSITGFATSPGFTGAGATPNFGASISGIQTVTPATTGVPTSAAFIGGATSFIFPQIASGGGWSTELLLANTSAGDQVVRVDIFTSEGRLANSITDILIPAQGVRFLSTEQEGGAIF